MMASATSSAARRAVSCVRQSIPGRGVASGRIQTASVQQVRVRCWCIALAWGFTPLSVFSRPFWLLFVAAWLCCFVVAGTVASIEENHKEKDQVGKGSQVAVKLEAINIAPVTFNRQFNKKSVLANSKL